MNIYYSGWVKDNYEKIINLDIEFIIKIEDPKYYNPFTYNPFNFSSCAAYFFSCYLLLSAKASQRMQWLPCLSCATILKGRG